MKMETVLASLHFCLRLFCMSAGMRREATPTLLSAVTHGDLDRREALVTGAGLAGANSTAHFILSR